MITNFNEFITEGLNNMMVYKNKDKSKNIYKDTISYTIFKGNEMYHVECRGIEIVNWKYQGKVNLNLYSVNGTLVSGKNNIGLFINLQKTLEPVKKEIK